MMCNAVITANGISTIKNTVTTTINMSVVQLASRNFLHSFLRFSRNNFFRLSCACFMARNNNTFNVTNDAHGNKCTNNMRNRKYELKYRSAPTYSSTHSAMPIWHTFVVWLFHSIVTIEYDLFHLKKKKRREKKRKGRMMSRKSDYAYFLIMARRKSNKISTHLLVEKSCALMKHRTNADVEYAFFYSGHRTPGACNWGMAHINISALSGSRSPE